MTRVRAVRAVDQIDRDGERVVLVPGRALRVTGIAPAVLDLTTDWTSLPDLVLALERLLGPDPSGEAASAVRAAVEHLADEGLVEIERDDQTL